MDNDCPECFGKKEQFGKIPDCEKCEYTESCKYCCDDDGKKCERNSGHVSYERYAYSREVATPASIPAEAEQINGSEYIPADDDNVRQVLEFLLDIDNYTAELVSAVLHDPQCTSASALARKFGVARQSMHRKLIDCCHLHPQLRKLFITRLTRCRRILTNSSRIERTQERNRNKSVTSENQNQMELF
jgi:hypothetical protein